MAQGIPHHVMADAALVKELAEVAKDTALLHGVQMRTRESPNSSEVRPNQHSFRFEVYSEWKGRMVRVRGWCWRSSGL